MGLCKHGVDLKHKRCERCEETAEAENRGKDRVPPPAEPARPKQFRPDYYAINPNRLDEEWLAQPRMYAEHAFELAQAREDHERAKTRLELVEAQLHREVQANPAVYGLEKATVGAIEMAVRVQSKYQRAAAELIEARRAMDDWQVAVSTMDHRKPALENLVRLRLADYYSEPRTPQGASKQEVTDMERQALKNRRKPLVPERK